jgi:surface antigen
MTKLKSVVQKSGGIRAKVRLWAASITLAGASLLFGHHAQASTKHPVRHNLTHFAANHMHHIGHVQLASSRHVIGEGHFGTAGRRHEHDYRIEKTGYHTHHLRYTARSWRSGLQCVPYAREVSHIELTGNAYLWWAEAAGRYARGNVPQEGAVLNFRGIGRMPLGHVAVVTSVIDSRTILVTQANWVPGSITNDVTMQDVSPENNWSEVQVELGDSSTWGAAYPTYGFIYNRPADSTIIAANAQSNEVAEAPTTQPVNTEAPDRNLQ